MSIPQQRRAAVALLLARSVAWVLSGLLFFATATIPVVHSIVQPPRCTAGPMRVLQASRPFLPGTVWVRSEGCDSGVFRGLRADLPRAK